MPTQLFSQSVAAATTVTNLLAGSKFEFLKRPSAIEVYAVFGGTTPSPGDVLMDLTFGDTIVGDNLNVYLEPGTDQGPDRNKHLISSGVGGPTDRIQVKIQNTHATIARNIRVLVVFRELM